MLIGPLLMYFTRGTHKTALETLMEEHPENKFFWPTLVAICVVLAVRNRSRLRDVIRPFHIKCLLAYLAFAGMSLLWAFKPEVSFVRFSAQAMIVISIILPAMLAARTTDLLHCIFLCYAVAVFLNPFFVLNQSPNMVENVSIGYPGYFTFKGILGECASIALLLSFYEILHSGFRRALAILVIIVSAWLIFVSQSKGSLAFALIAPAAAALTLIASRQMRISPATFLVTLLCSYFVFSAVTGFTMNKVSWYVYGNYNFSGRENIWQFAHNMIDRRPLLGWGYQSFWLVGFDGPSLEAGGWISAMPSAHSGYLDTRLEMGYVGFALLATFIIATLHAMGRVADRDPSRAWILLSLALYVVFTSFLETTWMRGAEPLWIAFLIATAETGRHCHPSRAGRAAPGMTTVRQPHLPLGRRGFAPGIGSGRQSRL